MHPFGTAFVELLDLGQVCWMWAGWLTREDIYSWYALGTQDSLRWQASKHFWILSPSVLSVCGGGGGRGDIHKQWCLSAPVITQSSSRSLPLGRCFSLVNWLPSLIVSVQANLHSGPSVIVLPTADFYIGGGVHIVTVSPSLLPFSLWSLFPLLCRSCLLSPQFFRRNCFVCRCTFCVYMRGDKFRLFLCCYLGPPHQSYLSTKKTLLNGHNNFLLNCA